MSTPLISLELAPIDENQIVDDACAAIKTLIPTWVKAEGHTEVVLIEASALQTAAVQFMLNQLGQQVLDNLIALKGIERLQPTAAVGTLTVTMSSATVGVKVMPANTRFRIYNGDGSSLDVLTTTDTTGNPSDSLTFVVQVIAEETGASLNSLEAATPAVLVDVLSWVESAVTVGSFAGGTDAETDAAFYPRVVAYFAAQNKSLVVATDFLAAALDVDGVGRAFVINLWDNSGSTPGTVGGHVTIAVATPAGGVASGPVKTAVAAHIVDLAVAGLTPHIVDPTLLAFVVTASIHVLPGFVSADVISNVTRALRTYLDPATRGWGQQIYINQLIVIAGEVPGVDRVISLSGTVGGTAIGTYTPGPLDLPSGPATVTVTAA